MKAASRPDKIKMSQSKFSFIQKIRFSVALAAILFLLPLADAHAIPVARLRNVRPSVQVRVAREAQFVGVREKYALRFGDTIRTDKKGKAELLFSNGTRVAMNGGSQLQILAPETKTSPMVIRVFGALSEVFVRPRGNTQVRTAAAIAAARGTAFLVQLPDENTAVVTVTEDEVEFFNNSGAVLLTEGEQSTAVVGKAPTTPVTVDASGELAWTAEIAGLPVDYETAFSTPDLDAAQIAAVQSPDDARAQLQLGDAQRAVGDAAAAKIAYQRALEIEPQNVAAHVGLSLTALSMGDLNGAQAALVPIGNTAEAQAVGGLIALQNADYIAAEKQLRNATQKSPQLYQAHALLALALLSQNELAEAQAAARRAVELAPRSSQAASTLSLVLFFSGEEFADEAEREANRAVALNPDSPLALLAKGRVLLLAREPEEAAAAFAQAAALLPRLEVAQREWGASLLLQGKPQSAAKAYRRALAINPASAEAQSGLGVALLRQGKVPEAQAAQQRALELDGDNATARANYAALLIEEGKLDEARRQLEAGLIAAPTRGLLYVRLSEASLFAQRLTDAQDFARKAVALIPNSALAFYQLGRVHLELERYTQAVQAFRKALLLQRDFPEARYALGFARELVETGRDPSRPSAAAGPGALNSVARALNIQNLQTPGAEDRLQALAKDPTVLRTATRSYGDTEIKGSFGDNGALDGEATHLHLSNDRRSIVGLSAQRESFDDVNGRKNSDFSTDRFGVTVGRKAADSPSSFFAIAQTERLEDGLNKGDQPGIGETARSEATKPRLLLGGNWQHNSNSSTRALLQYVKPEVNSTNDLFGDRQHDEVSSYNAELRHDLRLGRKHYINAGLFAGKRKRELNLFLAGFPPFFPDQRTRVNTGLSIYGGYIRDDFDLSSKLRLIGELKVIHAKGESSAELLAPMPLSFPTVTREKTALLPTFIAEYRAGVNTGVRLRVRRLFGSVRDFELLSPVDTFISPLNTLPMLDGVGTGTSIELEGDHTFRNGSFVRLGVFHQNLKDLLEPTADGSGTPVSHGRLQGARLGYEGSISRDVSFFLSGGYTRARDTGADRDIANVPRWTGEAGLFYLHHDGWFVQPSLFYQGARFRSDRSRAAAFSAVNLRIGKRFGLRGMAFIELRNACDESYDILDVEQQGRQLRAGFIGRF
jgi:tetratricopeptide (TPR) repeat protein